MSVCRVFMPRSASCLHLNARKSGRGGGLFVFGEGVRGRGGGGGGAGVEARGGGGGRGAFVLFKTSSFRKNGYRRRSTGKMRSRRRRGARRLKMKILNVAVIRER